MNRSRPLIFKEIHYIYIYNLIVNLYTTTLKQACLRARLKHFLSPRPWSGLFHLEGKQQQKISLKASSITFWQDKVTKWSFINLHALFLTVHCSRLIQYSLLLPHLPQANVGESPDSFKTRGVHVTVFFCSVRPPQVLVSTLPDML